MPIPIVCDGCETKLRIPDTMAGKKVRCPRCQAVLLVPSGDTAMPSARAAIRTSKVRKPVELDDLEPLDDEREDDPPQKSKYKPCPKCGAKESKRVLWTWWGSFYGPAMFSHVRCPRCGNGYNGKSGGSNTLAAVLFFTLPLVGILVLLGVVGWMVVARMKLLG